MATYPQLGELFLNGVNYSGETVWTQPGGPGTTVYPQQAFGEQVALFVFGCGHWSNHFDVRENDFNPPSFEVDYTVRSAFLCCPLCSYIQRIISPYDDIYNSVSNYVLLA